MVVRVFVRGTLSCKSFLHDVRLFWVVAKARLSGFSGVLGGCHSIGMQF